MKMKNYLIEKASDTKNKKKPHFSEPYLDKENNRMLASNGFIIASVPVEVEEGDDDGHIPVDALIAARKKATKQKSETIVVDASDAALKIHYEPDSRLAMGKPKNMDNVMRNRGPERHTITLDANYLLNLAKAINYRGGGTAVTLHLPQDPRSAVLVTPLNFEENKARNDAYGILMPILAGDAQND